MPLTDPAKELVDTLARIAVEPNTPLIDRISREAKVDPWSPDFFRIIFEILNRIDLVRSKVEELPLDDDVKVDALRSISSIRSVFSSSDVLLANSNGVRPKITGSNATVLKMLSIMIREKVSYPLLSDAEREQVIQEVAQLRDWLIDIDSDDKDFIRECLIDGLGAFIFRIERLNWLGHGYALDGLKEVIKAYLSLQGAQSISSNGAELQEAILTKVRAVITRVLGVFDIAKDNVDRADWALRAYGAVSALADGSTTVAGLLQ